MNTDSLMTVAGIPCYNEERYIGSVVLKALRYVTKVIVVDDGSIDETAEVAFCAGAQVIKHDKNMGAGKATQTLMDEAASMQADILVLLDGDGQHDASEIPLVMQPIISDETDVVIGSRFLGNGDKPPFYRQLGQKVLTETTNLLSGCKLTDSQSGFRALSQKALSCIALKEHGFCAVSEMQFHINHYGLKVKEVPIHVSYHDKAKRNPFAHGFYVLGRVGLIGAKNGLR